MTAAATERERPGGRAGGTAATFLALAALTGAELKVATSGLAGAAAATALSGLLLAKAALVLLVCLRADLRRRGAPRLAVAALLMAGAFAAVLMLEAAFQARVR
ncbi:MAG TPA: hypothetical protein VHO06_25045 [Polyangia bacterium]|nr:hypothetical protein [Polyangia bacterium]